MKATRLVLSIVAGVLSLAVASPAVAAGPTIVDETVTVTREDALAAYGEFGEVFQDCGDFVVLAAFTAEDRVITFEDRELRLVKFTGELFRPDTDVAVTYAGSARIELGFGPTGEVETISTTGLARYLIDLEGNRIVFDAGFFTGDFSSFPPTLMEHGLKRYEEVICSALA
ncbi:MAG TPA: hypothetical protein VFH23_01335 [Jiangellaceae bacterium]|nr:hypothetical protein [Jiangellaceae bacterium]